MIIPFVLSAFGFRSPWYKFYRGYLFPFGCAAGGGVRGGELLDDDGPLVDTNFIKVQYSPICSWTKGLVMHLKKYFSLQYDHSIQLAIRINCRAIVELVIEMPWHSYGIVNTDTHMLLLTPPQRHTSAQMRSFVKSKEPGFWLVRRPPTFRLKMGFSTMATAPMAIPSYNSMPLDQLDPPQCL
jgi:hypothetical protein